MESNGSGREHSHKKGNSREAKGLSFLIHFSKCQLEISLGVLIWHFTSNMSKSIICFFLASHLCFLLSAFTITTNYPSHCANPSLEVALSVPSSLTSSQSTGILNSITEVVPKLASPLSSQGSPSSNAGVHQLFFCKGPNSKYVQLCEPYVLAMSTQFCGCIMKTGTTTYKQMGVVVFNKAVFQVCWPLLTLERTSESLSLKQINLQAFVVSHFLQKKICMPLPLEKSLMIFPNPFPASSSLSPVLSISCTFLSLCTLLLLPFPFFPGKSYSFLHPVQMWVLS